MESPNASATNTATDTQCKVANGSKREVTPEQEGAMKKRPKVSNDGKDASNENCNVCEFLIQDLRAGRGHAANNYCLSMLVGEHGLFDLVLKVFEILHHQKLTTDQYYSHLWSISFDGKSYHNGWRGCLLGPQSHVDEEDIRPLHNLRLQQGQKGKFRGQSASFLFVVQKINGVPDKKVQYPIYSAIHQSFSSALSDDWISADQVTATLKARDHWKDYYNGQNSSKRCSRTFEVVPCKPLPPQWIPSELELLGLLINAGHKFTKAWKTILQYALVARPKAATSGQWYKLQKESYRREYIGRSKSSAEMTLLAKNLAKTNVENIPSPPSHAEILAERNNMIKRRQLLRMGRNPDCFDSDSDGY